MIWECISPSDWLDLNNSKLEMDSLAGVGKTAYIFIFFTVAVLILRHDVANEYPAIAFLSQSLTRMSQVKGQIY